MLPDLMWALCRAYRALGAAAAPPRYAHVNERAYRDGQSGGESGIARRHPRAPRGRAAQRQPWPAIVRRDACGGARIRAPRLRRTLDAAVWLPQLPTTAFDHADAHLNFVFGHRPGRGARSQRTPADAVRRASQSTATPLELTTRNGRTTAATAAVASPTCCRRRRKAGLRRCSPRRDRGAVARAQAAAANRGGHTLGSALARRPTPEIQPLYAQEPAARPTSDAAEAARRRQQAARAAARGSRPRIVKVREKFGA